MDRTSILNAFIKLAELTSIKSNDFYKKNPTSFTVIEKEYRPIKDVTYNGFSTGYNLDRKNYRRAPFYEPKILPITEFIQKEILTSDESKESLNLLCDWIKSQVNNPSAIPNGEENPYLKGAVQMFVSKIALNSVTNILSAETILNYADYFVKDETKEGITAINIELYLTCLSIEKEKFNISDTIELRKPSNKDFEEWTTNFYESEMDLYTSRSSEVTSILTLQSKIKNDFIFPDQFNKIVQERCIISLSAIKLFSINSVYPLGAASSSNSLKYAPFLTQYYPFTEYFERNNLPGFGMGIYYELKENEVLKLGKFIEEIYPILLKWLTSLDNNPYEVAYYCYHDALFKSSLSIDKAANCVYCLESIFNEYKPRVDQKKIKRRIIHFLSLSLKKKEEEVSIEFDIERAFEIRNQFSHKAKIDEALKEFSQKNIRNILNYTRIALIGFLQLSAVMEKQELLKKLDEVEKNKTVEKELINIIEQNVFIPNTDN